MKTQAKILTAFLLNLTFSILEFFGGIISGSYAIMSDALHDAADALGIGVSLLFEKKSKESPDETYTFGYGRFSLLGALFTTSVLLTGSVYIIINAIQKIRNPAEIDYGKMIVFAVIGVLINSVSAYVTMGKNSINQRAVNLHMLEDVLGWICVLVGAIIMHFSDLYIIDPLMSIGISLFIVFNSIKNLMDIFGIFLERVPGGINVSEIKDHIMQIEGLADIHHLHIWSYDENNILATMHIVTNKNAIEIKSVIREELCKHGIHHATLEFENIGETCPTRVCNISHKNSHTHCHKAHHGH